MTTTIKTMPETLEENPPVTTAQSSGIEWHPTTRVYHVDLDALYQQLDELTPTRAEFLKRAGDQSPPQSWWDDTTDPFETEE